MRRETLLFLGCMALLPAPPAAAGNLCGVEAYRPPAVLKEVTEMLPGIAVSAIAAFPSAVEVADLPAGRIALVRGGAIVGQIAHVSDVTAEKDDVTVFGADGKVLMEVSETAVVCPPGLCHQVTTITALQPPLAGGVPPFAMQLGPDDDAVPVYFRYGLPAGPSTWHRAYGDALKWLSTTLRTTTVVKAPAVTSDVQQVFWALASDPAIAPYLDRLAIDHLGPGGRLTIHGVAPSNEIYDLILQRALEAGHPELAPDMIIDTRTLIVPDADPVLGCPVL